MVASKKHWRHAINHMTEPEIQVYTVFELAATR